MIFAVCLLSVIAFRPTPISSYGDAAPNYYTSVVVATTLTVNTTSTQILATNTGRLTGQVINVGTSTVYCKMDGNVTAPRVPTRLPLVIVKPAPIVFWPVKARTVPGVADPPDDVAQAVDPNLIETDVFHLTPDDGDDG